MEQILDQKIRNRKWITQKKEFKYLIFFTEKICRIYRQNRIFPRTNFAESISQKLWKNCWEKINSTFWRFKISLITKSLQTYLFKTSNLVNREIIDACTFFRWFWYEIGRRVHLNVLYLCFQNLPRLWNLSFNF